ncbi:hypothetical protein Ngar_c19140 [Candidatus Nitrososphaera gargensis Ga9.2]|uniref:Uncharacterized protein n=1 Tax=Nitrososphaera gargensis (strain Ga9.2) TaxID=1237085 RepID=K0IBZ7_NITGG|nr:hypothetical protein [Candidatus Nitrososphaera gargensis]AFU58846.1 hypothetical protein Ngar_c19140 [Candidatus Nitrososphaera gargensis Ga9.2]
MGYYFLHKAAFTKSDKFDKGFAIGIGSVAANLSKDLLHESLLSEGKRNESFAENFGFGVGHIISLLDSDKRHFRNNEE